MSTDVTGAMTPLSERVADEIRAWMGRRRMSGAAAPPLTREASMARQRTYPPEALDPLGRIPDKQRETEMAKIANIAELSTAAYVRAQRKALIHIVAPGDNASHDRAIWEIDYADGSTERISASVKGAVALEEAGYVIRCISEITE